MENYAEKIYILIHHCHEQCLKLMHLSDQSTGLSTRQGLILKLLLQQDGMTQKELTQRLQITSSSCGELISKLAHSNYLTRQANPNDKRTYRIYLTENGKKLGEYYQAKSMVELEMWAADLTQQEKTQLFQLLTKLSRGLKHHITEEKKSPNERKQ